MFTRTRWQTLQAAFTIIIAVSAGLISHAADQKLAHFLTRRGDQLYDGDRLFRFISFNIPNLVLMEDAYEFMKPSPWRWPTEYEIEDALESVRQMGGQVARTYVISVFREGSDMGEFIHVRKPGDFNEEGFRALDKLLEVANRKGIRIIIPFVDHAKWWGGVGEYAAFRGKPAEAFWTDPQIIDDFKATIRFVLERKNTYTGIKYRDDPAVFGWETGNEIVPPPEWTRQIAAYIRQLDKNHLILDGQSLNSFPTASLDDPNIDVISSHHYPFGDNHDFVKPIREAHARAKGKKAFFVGEFGFVETPHIANAIQTVIDDGISGALLWSLRMHRREGGFYWHMEVGTGKNIYKAFHWPGFKSGQRYDEQAVVALVREKAYEIRGLKPPALERLAPPTLLPIEKVSAISWQGTTGASGYDIWRAAAEAGPWDKIAANFSDADVQYRPLFNDDTAAVGKKYWYRIVARNSAGESAPSNIVGPVGVVCRTLVDECRDLTQTASTTGKVSLASENARTVQEDCHRFALEPGAEVVYHVGGPIKSWTIYAFAQNDSKLQFQTGTKQGGYRVVKPERKTLPSAQTVYGYLTPILFTGTAGDEATDLKISYLADKPTKTGDSKPGQPQVPKVELSRVEIEFGDVARSSDAAANRPTAPTQLNSSVFIEPGRSVDAALKAIDDAANHGERQLNVVISVLVDLTDELKIDSFGTYEDGTFNYEVFVGETRALLRKNLRRVFERMVQHNMGIFILPHIDPGGRVQQWRNWVDFDPLVSYGGESYSELVLGSIADELVQTIRPNTAVEFCLSGEMGTSLFKYPESYRKIVERLRRRPELKHMKIGVSLNHNKVAGQSNPTGAKDIVLTAEKRLVLQNLIEDCDFIGISAYFPMSVPPTKDDFVRGIDGFMSELNQFGLTVSSETPLQFTEVGIGGRSPLHGEIDVKSAAAKPWEGAGLPQHSPWKDPAMKALRVQYHQNLFDFLTVQPSRYRVTSAFLWSSGSWDPWGRGFPEFADPTIAVAIERHNRGLEH